MSYTKKTKLLIPMGGAFGSGLLDDWSLYRRTDIIMRGSPFLDYSKSLGYLSSGYFGPGDSPEINMPDLDLTGVFTLEAWVYLPESSASGDFNSICSFMTFGSNEHRLQWYVSNNSVRLWTSGGSGHLLNFDSTPYLGNENKWTHIVTQRNEDTSIDVFLDGNLLHTEPSSLSPQFSKNAIINYARAGGNHRYSDGMWIQDLRVTVGSALYDSSTNFTPLIRLLGKLEGVVIDSNGNPAQRRVISYVRDTGHKFSEVVSGVSGEFSVAAYSGAECYAVSLSPYDNENALVYDRLEPVQP